MFAHENSFGNATVTLSSPLRVGIVIVDNPHYDNRGSATFVLRNSDQAFSGKMMRESVNVLPDTDDFGNTTLRDKSLRTEAAVRS